MDLKPEWYDAIPKRQSRRTYRDRPVPPELRAHLEAFCAEASAPTDPARVCLVDDLGQTLFKGMLGSYGKVTGTPLVAAFVGRGTDPRAAVAQTAFVFGPASLPITPHAAAGYLGEALVLEAVHHGLGTCWIAGMFKKARAAKLVGLRPGEAVVAVSPLGYPTGEQPSGERFMRRMTKASARVSVEKIAPDILDGSWPQWAVTAVQAARLAPSGGNRQPWRFRMDDGALVLSQTERLYWTSPIDLGIVRLHVALGAAHEGVTGAWTELDAPDVASFTPAS